MTIEADILDIGRTTGAAVAAIARSLEEAGVASARLDARLLVCAATGESTAGLIAHPERPVLAVERGRLSAMAARRCAREPVAHILGRREFWSLDFEVSAAVLTPRPDSETLVEAVCRHIAEPDQPVRILDLGTGSGCLLLALLSELPAASGVGVDISPAAVALARRNAQRLGIDARAGFIVGDWTAPIADSFDIVVGNPPYIPSADIEALEPEVARYEPRGALDGGVDGLNAYRALLPLAAGVLAPGGVIFFELGAGQHEAIPALADAAGLHVADLRADIAGIPRVAILRQG